MSDKETTKTYAKCEYLIIRSSGNLEHLFLDNNQLKCGADANTYFNGVPYCPIHYPETGKQAKEGSFTQEGGGKRDPVDYRYDLLNWKFLRGMARIAAYASRTYDDRPDVPWGELNYQKNELIGEKSPINHAIYHIQKYIEGEPYDRWGGNRVWHLIAGAYNLMMAFYHESRRQE